LQAPAFPFRTGWFYQLIQTVQGGSGKISITDFNAVKGQENRYFVVVENPLALSNGQPLSSAASKRVSIFVP